MSETPSLESNGPDAESEIQHSAVQPGDSGPDDDGAMSAQDAASPDETVAPARTLIVEEPGVLLHDRAPVPVEETPATRRAPAAALAVDHVPGVGHAYPGEPVVLHTRVRVLEEMQGFQLVVELPRWVRVGEVHAPAEAGVYALEVGELREQLHWEVRQPLSVGAVFQFETTVTVPALDHLVHAFSSADVLEHEITSDASAAPYLADSGQAAVRARETAVVALRRKGSYLKHLPAVFERDPFMARFLMLFESFWAPIDGQIDSMADYFDPMLTTLPMLKWLADRLDLQVDDELPVEVLRKLVAKAIPLYRRRGTRSGLEELLEIYTGGDVEIVERRANNLRLGSGARLGHGVALGVRNQPHTFTLYIKLPAIADDPAWPDVSVRQRERRRERIRTLIELEKPAHVTYTLELEEV